MTLCVPVLSESDVRQIVASRCRRMVQDGGRSGQIERARIKTLKVTIVIGKHNSPAETNACTCNDTHTNTHTTTQLMHARTHTNT